MTSNVAVEQSATNTQFMLETFDQVRTLLRNLKSTLDELEGVPGIEPEDVRSFRDAIFCVELGMTYYAEANRAIQAQAWFAGSAVAAAALEAVLMAKCLFEREKVRALPKWKELQKVHKDKFDVFVRGLDLGKLLEIAQSMGWFPAGGLPTQIEQILLTTLDAATFQIIQNLFRDQKNLGQVCASHVREYRNLLHPSVCLREDHLPTPEAGLTATFLFLIAFMSLTEPREVGTSA